MEFPSYFPKISFIGGGIKIWNVMKGLSFANVIKHAIKKKVTSQNWKKVKSYLIPQFGKKFVDSSWVVLEVVLTVVLPTISRVVNLMQISNNIKAIVISFEKAIHGYFFFCFSRIKGTSGVALCVKLRLKNHEKPDLLYL